jgi:hypothetical protein
VFKTIGSKEISQINRDNLKDIEREAIRHFKSKRRKFLKDSINDLSAKRMDKNTKDLYTSTNLVKDEIYDMFGDSHNILNRGKLTDVIIETCSLL